MPHSLKIYTKTAEAGSHAYEALKRKYPKQIFSDMKAPELVGDSRKDTLWNEYKYQMTLIFGRSAVKSFPEAEKLAVEMAGFLRTSGQVPELLVRTDGAQGCVGHRNNYAATFIIG